VLGIAFDGTGYGTDGTAWGGEFLIGDARGVTRVATFRAIPLPGGDAAIRQPWRIALSMVLDAMGPSAPLDDLPLFRSLDRGAMSGVRQMLAANLNAPLARGVGRYFDGIGALVLARSRASYEGQVAFDLNMAATVQESRAYEFDVDRSSPVMEIDFRPVVRRVVDEVVNGTPAGIISARFHNTLIEATAAVAREVVGAFAGQRSRPAIVLTGGCFQNVRLAEGVVAALGQDHDVYVHRNVPPGDGGIALGQAVVAAASGRG
jgi:hydrogenase maturation protein HypF